MLKKFALSGSLAAWTLTVCKNELWRVTPLMDFDDLLGEARLVFWQCVCKYRGKVENEKHFAALYRKSLINRIHRFAEKRGRRREVSASALSLNLDYAGFAAHSATEKTDVNELVLHAPDPVKRLVRRLIPSRGYNRAASVPERQKGERLNAFLCRMAGESESTDMVEMVRMAFGS